MEGLGRGDRDEQDGHGLRGQSSPDQVERGDDGEGTLQLALWTASHPPCGEISRGEGSTKERKLRLPQSAKRKKTGMKSRPNGQNRHLESTTEIGEDDRPSVLTRSVGVYIERRGRASAATRCSSWAREIESGALELGSTGCVRVVTRSWRGTLEVAGR